MGEWTGSSAPGDCSEGLLPRIPSGATSEEGSGGRRGRWRGLGLGAWRAGQRSPEAGPRARLRAEPWATQAQSGQGQPVPGAALRRQRRAALLVRTWGPADVGGEEPVGSLPGIWAHQEELPEVGHVEHSRGPSAGQTLLLDLKSSRVGVRWGLRDPPPQQRPRSPGLQDPLLPSSQKPTGTLSSGAGMPCGAGGPAGAGPREDTLQGRRPHRACSLTTWSQVRIRSRRKMWKFTNT